VDFQFGVTTDGQPIKIVSIVDEHTRECLGGMIDRNITGEHLIGELDRLAAERGTFPTVLRCDNGPELACGAMADWAAGQVGLHFIPPGSRRATATSSHSTPASATNVSTSTASGHRRLETRLTTTADIPRWATNRRPVTLPAVPTNGRLSFAVDQSWGPVTPLVQFR
jgi:hypothetical protein